MAKHYQAHAAQDEQPTQTGEGITFSTEPRARLWAVEVPFPGRQPMRCTIKATSQRQALQFAAARHPGADPNRIRILSKSEAGGLL